MGTRFVFIGIPTFCWYSLVPKGIKILSRRNERASQTHKTYAANNNNNNGHWNSCENITI